MSFLWSLLPPRGQLPNAPSLVSSGTTKRNAVETNHFVELSKLYTRTFSSCLEDNAPLSLDELHVAYYQSTARLVFQLNGTSSDMYDDLKLHWVIHAYGEDRLQLDHNPCQDNLDNLCHTKPNGTIGSTFEIKVSGAESQKLNFLANPIPDLDGYVRLNIFSSSNQEIGCYQAALTTGHSLSQPQYFGVFLVVFTLAATLNSFLSAVYGVSVPHVRRHHAHSISVLAVLETFQSIFLTGAISVEWPAVLPAWWSNFAWSVGLVPEKGLIRALSNSTGVAKPARDTAKNNATIFSGAIGGHKDATILNVSDCPWSSNLATPGLTVPGHWPGFMGTISRVDIPPSSAAMMSLIWLITLLAVVFASVCAAKGLLELLAKLKILKSDGFDYFRRNWLEYGGICVARVFCVSFSPLVTLSCFQMAFRAHAGPTAVSTLVLLIALAFFGGASGHLYYSLRHILGRSEDVEARADASWRAIVSSSNTKHSRSEGKDSEAPVQGADKQNVNPASKSSKNSPELENPPNLYECYSWLIARYRETRWWFFTFTLTFQFIQAALLGGGTGNPTAQIAGSLMIDIIYLVLLLALNPFESNRNTSMAIVLSFANIITTSLTIGLLPQLEIDELYRQIIGFIIVILQGAMTLAVLVLIGTGVVTTGLSLSRNREGFGGRLDRWRVKYFEHVEKPVISRDDPNTKGDAERVASTPNVEAAQEIPADNTEIQHTAATSALNRIGKKSTSTNSTDETPVPNALSHRHSIHTNIPAGPRSMPLARNLTTRRRPHSMHVPRRKWSGSELNLWDAASLGSEAVRMTGARSKSLRRQAISLCQGMESDSVELRPLGSSPELASDDTEQLFGADQASGIKESEEKQAVAHGGIASTLQAQSSGYLTVPKDDRTDRESNSISSESSWFDDFKSYCHVIAEEDEGEDEGAVPRQAPQGPRPEPKNKAFDDAKDPWIHRTKTVPESLSAAEENDQKTRPLTRWDTPRITVSGPEEEGCTTIHP